MVMADDALNHILFFSFLISISMDLSSSASCPMDLTYVETVPWNTSQCKNGDDKLCCQTLLSLFGIGIAQRLKDASLFQLPDAGASSACLDEFQTRLEAVSVRPSLVPFCFHNSTQFVANKSSCAGIVSTEDWARRVGGNDGLLTSSCKGDLTGLTRCSSCLDAGLRVTSELKSLDMNETKCFYFTVLYAAGVVNEFGPKDARTAACIFGLPLAGTSASRGSSRGGLALRLLFGFTGALIGALAAFALLIFCKSMNKRRKQESAHQEFVSSLRARVMPNNAGKWFRLVELERATNGFSTKNVVGQGTYGVVYKGILPDGTLIAVKQILDLDATCDEDFANEVEIISKIRHRNLLPLRGCCVASDNLNGKRRFLIYDYMFRGSVSENLGLTASNLIKKKLTWPERKSIVLDVAKGMAYLHYGIKPAIFHRDIKATNVLLDSDMKAKVADFGLARQGTEGQSHLTTRVAGTHGYLAPEYALYGQLTEKSDVYSFGILILEIMSGRKALDTSNSCAVLITDWVWKLVKSGRVDRSFEECIREKGPKGVMERFVLVGVLCAHAMVAFRPTIADALKMLEGDIDIPEIPDRPLPLSHESFRSSLQLKHSTSGSINNNNNGYF